MKVFMSKNSYKLYTANFIVSIHLHRFECDMKGIDCSGLIGYFGSAKNETITVCFVLVWKSPCDWALFNYQNILQWNIHTI